MSNVTEMLISWGQGDEEAFDRLVPLVYSELKQLAHARLRAERDGHTLNTTGLVHEAYLRLVDIDRVQWSDGSHFFNMASRTMRRILVDHARKRARLKRSGGAPVQLDEEDLLVDAEHASIVLEIDKALKELERDHPRQCKAMELLYFGGLKQKEVATVLGVSQPTVARDIRFARAWLTSALD